MVPRLDRASITISIAHWNILAGTIISVPVLSHCIFLLVLMNNYGGLRDLVLVGFMFGVELMAPILIENLPFIFLGCQHVRSEDLAIFVR